MRACSIGWTRLARVILGGALAASSALVVCVDWRAGCLAAPLVLLVEARGSSGRGSGRGIASLAALGAATGALVLVLRRRAG